MLKHYLKEMPLLRWARLLVLLLLLPVLGQAAPFTPGNLVVVRVGDGSAGLTSAATVVVLLEYTPAYWCSPYPCPRQYRVPIAF